MRRKSTCDIITDVAAELFGTAGLRKTTMETIAIAAGRGRRTVYVYFRNKAEIYEAVVKKEISLITGTLSEVVISGKSFDETLYNYSEVRITVLENLIKRNPLLVRDFAQGRSRVEHLRDRLQKAELGILAPLFRKNLIPGNDFVQTTPEDFALIFVNLLKGADKLLIKQNGYDEALRLSTVSVDMFLKGIADQRK